MRVSSEMRFSVSSFRFIRSVETSTEADASVFSGFTTEGVTYRIDLADLPTGTLVVVADDDGTGTGTIDECDEDNNELVLEGLCSDD